MKDYIVNGKIVTINLENGKSYKAETAYLEKMMKNLDIDMEEAVLTWLEDEGYLINDEQEELCIAAKDNKVLASLQRTKGSKPEKKTQRERVVKENPTKEMIIAEIANCINAIDGATDIIIENKGKIVTFNLNGESYKIDLVQKRKPKENK